MESLGGELVRPILTPRFVPSCTRQLLAGQIDTLVDKTCLAGSMAKVQVDLLGLKGRISSLSTLRFYSFAREEAASSQLLQTHVSESIISPYITVCRSGQDGY